MLAKKDIKGKIIVWDAIKTETNEGVSITTSSGELLGKKTLSLPYIVEGKNIGKANETNASIQADKEIDALIKAKLRKGYELINPLLYLTYQTDEALNSYLETNLKYDLTDLDGNVSPMYCQQYYRSKKNWTDPTGKVWDDRKYYYLANPNSPKEKNAIIPKFPAVGQPKINGARGTISYSPTKGVQLLSKMGLAYNIPHIKKIFEDNLEVFEGGVVFDGEFYIYNEPLQVISSALKATNLDTPRIVFVMFDIAIPNVIFAKRSKMLERLYFKLQGYNYDIRLIEEVTVNSDKEVQHYTDKWIKEGFEGAIIRNPLGLYAFGKRPMDMVKLKRTISDEFKIVDVVPQAKNPSLGLFVCVTPEGKQFEVNPKGDNEFKSAILFIKHTLIGKPLTCTFYEYTEDKIPFHIIDNIIRDYE